MVKLPLLKPVFAGESGVVTSEHALSSIAGLDVLNRGGNAVDASVTVSFVLSVVQPSLCGLGGDFMAMIYNDGSVKFINGSGWAPEDLEDVIRKKGLSEVPRFGPLSPVVPGFVYGVYEMWRKYGSMEWKELLEMPVRIAEKGLVLSGRLAAAVEEMLSGYHDEATASIFGKGRWERIELKGLAEVIKGLAEYGPEYFYDEVSKDIADYVQSLGGVMKKNDFTSFRPEEAEPLSLVYRDYRIYESPPNSQGITTLMILNQLKDKRLEFDDAGIKRAIKAYEAAYAIRDRYLGDPRFVDVPVERMLSVSAKPNGTRIEDGDTTNFVVMDGKGMVVSGIHSLYYSFGSRITHPKHMIVLNNRASDFKLSGPNSLKPHKRPLHTLSSVIATKNASFSFAFGISGGHYRPQQHFLIITNIIDRGMNIGEAIEAPRFLWDGKQAFAEEGIKAGIKKIRYPGATGVGHGVQLVGRERLAYADIRGDGIAIGQI